MQNKFFAILILIVGLSFFNVSGQETISGTNAAKPINGGVINGKAKSLPKPEYPAEARAANAGGTIDVQVTIDENGDVISATAVSGHPLLRAAAEQAALKAKFNPTLLGGQPVKVTGIVKYNFMPAGAGTFYRTNWAQTGMMLSALEKLPTLRFFEPEVLMQAFPSDWAVERQQIERLKELKKAELAVPTNNVPKSRVIDSRTTKNQSDGTPLTVVTSAVSASEKTAPSEIVAIAQSLISSAQGRLGAEPLNSWYFNLGLNVNQALDKADSRVEKERLDSAETFRAFIKTAPAEVSENLVKDLQKMPLLIEKGIFTDQDKIEATQLMMSLNAIR